EGARRKEPFSVQACNAAPGAVYGRVKRRQVTSVHDRQSPPVGAEDLPIVGGVQLATESCTPSSRIPQRAKERRGLFADREIHGRSKRRNLQAGAGEPFERGGREADVRGDRVECLGIVDPEAAADNLAARAAPRGDEQEAHAAMNRKNAPAIV